MGATVAVAAHAMAGLVLLAGAGKLLRPTVARDALALSWLPGAHWWVQLLGVGEIVLAVTVLAVGGRPAFTLLAIAYAAFVVVAERQRRAGRGCGCFGATSTTVVGPLHLGVDVTAAVIAGAAAWSAVPGLAGVLPTGPVAGAVALGLVIVAVALGQLMLTSLPELLAARATASGDATGASMPAFSLSGARP